MVKNPPAMQEMPVQSLGQEDLLEEGTATHSTIAWRIPWTEEPGRLQFTGSHRVGLKRLSMHIYHFPTRDLLFEWGWGCSISVTMDSARWQAFNNVIISHIFVCQVLSQS